MGSQSGASWLRARERERKREREREIERERERERGGVARAGRWKGRAQDLGAGAELREDRLVPGRVDQPADRPGLLLLERVRAARPLRPVDALLAAGGGAVDVALGEVEPAVAGVGGDDDAAGSLEQRRQLG